MTIEFDMANTDGNRPYRPYLVSDLRALAGKKSTTEDEIDLIFQELGNRTTSQAKKFLLELVKRYPRLNSDKDQVVKKQVAKKAAKKVAKEATAPRSKIDSPNVFIYEENSIAYEFLRNTFTEAGELLGKWGMTPTLPEEILEKTFMLWSEYLKGNKDIMYRTLEQLDADHKKYTKLRTTAKKKAEKK